MKGLKTRKKRGTALFLIPALILTMCIGAQTAVFAEDAGTDAGSAEYWSIRAEADGGTATVTVGLEQAVTATGGTFTLSYDADVYTLSTDDADEAVIQTVPEAFSADGAYYSVGMSDGSVTIAWYAADAVNGAPLAADDTFLEFTFAYDDTTDNAYAFTYTCSEFYNEDVEDIADALTTVSVSGTFEHTHVYESDPIWVWSNDYTEATAVFACIQTDDCTAAERIAGTVVKEGTEATCTSDGSLLYYAVASRDGVPYVDSRSVTTEATGHSYDTENPVWTWAEDYSSADVTLLCANDASHTETVTAVVTSETTEATGTADGAIVYTASAVYGTETLTSTQTVVIPAAGDDAGGSGGAGDDTENGGEGNQDDNGEDQNGSGEGTTSGSSYTVPDESVSASKISLTGANAEQVSETLLKLSDDGDLADSSYALLQAKASKTTKKSVRLTWKKVSGAATYVVYANRCGKNKKLKEYKTTSGTSLNITKIAGKKLTKGKYYKFLVVAYDENGEVIATSKTVHAATKGGSVTNEKSLTLYKGKQKVKSVSLKKGKTVKLTAKSTLQDKTKKLKRHRKTKYESSNPKIASVNANGKIKAKAKGTCYIYAYAQNGVCKRIKVTVK